MPIARFKKVTIEITAEGFEGFFAVPIASVIQLSPRYSVKRVQINWDEGIPAKMKCLGYEIYKHLRGALFQRKVTDEELTRSIAGYCLRYWRRYLIADVEKFKVLLAQRIYQMAHSTEHLSANREFLDRAYEYVRYIPDSQGRSQIQAFCETYDIIPVSGNRSPRFGKDVSTRMKKKASMR